MELVRAGKLTGGVVLRKVLYCEVQERQFDAFWNSENGVASPAPRDFFYLDVLKGDYQEFYLRVAGILSARDDALVDVFAVRAIVRQCGRCFVDPLFDRDVGDRRLLGGVALLKPVRRAVLDVSTPIMYLDRHFVFVIQGFAQERV